MDIHSTPNAAATVQVLGVYDDAGRYLGPAPVAIRFYPRDPRDVRHAQEAA